MFLPELSIKRPVLATVMSLLIVLVGVISFLRLTVREYPKIDTPVVSVRTVYKGASAQVMESQVTQPLEDSISGIEGVKSIKSVSREEVSQITVEFVLERATDAAANDVRDRVSRVRGPAPRRGGRADHRQDRGRRAGHHLAAAQLGPPRRAGDLRLRRPLRRRPPEDAARAWRASSSAASAATRCACGSTASGSPATG